MSNEITDAEVKQAQIPHNLFITGLFVFDLMMTPAVIVLKLGMAGMLTSTHRIHLSTKQKSELAFC
jgi:hypothetical protein